MKVVILDLLRTQGLFEGTSTYFARNIEEAAMIEEA